MSVDVGVDQKEKRAFQDVQILGPLFILCTFALSPTHWFLFSVGLIGLILCAYQRLRGFVVSLVCLTVAGGIEHVLSSGHHGWLLGLEASYAIAFFITSLSAEQMDAVFSSIDGRSLARNQFLADLEEEFQKSRESLTLQQVSAQEKIERLQKEMEEGESEKNSLFMLNEVLRKTAAQESLAKEQWKTLYEKEKNQQVAIIPDRSLEIQELSNTIVKLREELELQNQQVAIMPDRSLEIQELSNTIVKLREELELRKHDEKPQMVEYLYKQLRQQFEEKNRILHEVRSQAFHQDTHFQVKQMDEMRKEEEKDVSISSREAAHLSHQLLTLEKENQTLEELISNLLSSSRKKKDE